MMRRLVAFKPPHPNAASQGSAPFALSPSAGEGGEPALWAGEQGEGDGFASISSALAVACVLTFASPAHAEAIRNPIAVFSGLDKITGTITTFEVPIDETKRFGALSVRPRVCYSQPVTEQPKTTSFVEVDEELAGGDERRVFTGWMLAESPGLNAVEHPVFDVWLIGCRDPNAPEIVQEAAPERVEIQPGELPTDND